MNLSANFPTDFHTPIGEMGLAVVWVANVQRAGAGSVRFSRGFEFLPAG